MQDRLRLEPAVMRGGWREDGLDCTLRLPLISSAVRLGSV